MTGEKSSPHIDFLDSIRGIAILSVFLFHALSVSFGAGMLPWNGWLRDFDVPKALIALLPLHFGWAGVAIFFVISGFCIHHSFQAQGREWSGFFTRRFFRLYPAYLLALLVFAFIVPSTRLIFDDQPHPDLWSQLISHLFLIHNFNPSTFGGINVSFWSIAVEVQLYFLYPVLLFLAGKFGWRRAMALVATCEILIHGLESMTTSLIAAQVSCGFRFPSSLFQYTPYIRCLEASPFAYWFSWALGAFVADAYLKGKRLPLGKTSIPFWSILLLLSYFVRPLSPFFFLFTAVLTAAVICRLLAGARPAWPVPGLFLKHLRQTGICSYSIYLLHQPLVGIASKIPVLFLPEANTPPLLKFSCCLLAWPVIMLLGYLCYRTCEMPGIAWGKRIIARRLLSSQEKR